MFICFYRCLRLVQRDELMGCHFFHINNTNYSRKNNKIEILLGNVLFM